MLLPLQGASDYRSDIPRAMPWARSFWAFSPYLNHLRNLNLVEHPCNSCNSCLIL